MKHHFAGVAALACCLVLMAATSATGAPPRALLRSFSCHRAIDPASRSVSVTAVMRPMVGTRHLAIKFDLMMSAGSGSPQKAVRAGDLGVWKTPKTPTLGQLPGDVWNLQKSVVALAAPATYRFRVMYRWTGMSGHVLATTVRFSHTCRQRELRPDLAVTSISVTPDPMNPSRDDYSAVIANLGNSSAGPFEVLFATADGTVAQADTIDLLKAHSSITDTFNGPLCTAANAPTITADSTDEVNDLNRANNAMPAVCPAPATG
jgi:CARDB